MVDDFQGVQYDLVHGEVDYMVDNERLLNYMIEVRYLTPREAMYYRRYDFCVEPNEWNSFLNFKDGQVLRKREPFRLPDLMSFNDHPIHYAVSQELILLNNEILKLAIDDFNENSSFVTIRNFDDLIKSRIYSEIESTLSLEAVQTTRKRVKEIVSERITPAFKNDFIVRNMARGIEFVLKRPEFNDENLFTLYSILSDGQLDENCQLREGEHYRYDEVMVDVYKGAPNKTIGSCLDSLFSYVNHVLQEGDSLEKFFLPYIAHYYIVYVHPYFDYNGRTARMVSFWLSLLTQHSPFLFASEAIDQTKNRYYEALSDSRDCHNDLTYFFRYLLQISFDYYNCYKNIEYVDQILKNRGIVLTDGERAYIKKILISSKGAFVYGDFLKWTKSDMSKQAAFKILNGFVRDGFLLTRESSSKNKLFEVNSEFVPYRMKHFNE